MEPIQAIAPVTGPSTPQPMVARIDLADQLLRVDVGMVSTPTVWVVGVHGGSAETTVAALFDGAVATGHRWPIARPGSSTAPVLLVTRTAMNDLRAAQNAAMEWASGEIPVSLVGLVVVPDTPGRLPRPLVDMAKVVAGGVPRTWWLPWVEQWRMGAQVTAPDAPKAVQTVVAELQNLLNNPT